MDAYSKYLSNALNKYKIHVSSYHGNAGDELIIKATFKIFKIVIFYKKNYDSFSKYNYENIIISNDQISS